MTGTALTSIVPGVDSKVVRDLERPEGEHRPAAEYLEAERRAAEYLEAEYLEAERQKAERPVAVPGQQGLARPILAWSSM